MANKTVYPYGTGGTLPASIGIINDLRTGGADKALSAEQGKVIGDVLFDETTYESDNLTPLSTYNDLQFKADSSQVGKALSSVTTYEDTGFRNYKISVKGAYSVTYRKYVSTYDFGCLFLDSSNVVISGIVSSSSDPTMRTVGIPEGAAWFIWSYKPSTESDASKRVCIVKYEKSNAMQTEIDDLGASVVSINGEIGKSLVTEAAFSELTHVKSGYQLKADSSQVGVSLNNVDTYANANYVNVKVPVENCSRIELRSFSSQSGYGHLFVDENDVVLKGFVNDTGTYGPFSVDVPSDAKYFVYSYSTSSTYSKTITRYSKDGILSRLDEVSAKEPTVLVSGKSPELTRGRVNSSGAPVANDAYYITEPIFGDFFLQLADGWRVYEGHLYDRSGKIVSYRHVNPNVSHTGTRGTWSNRLFFSQANDVPDYGIRLTLCKSDQSAIADGEMPVTNFVLLSDSGLHRWVPADLPKYDVALRRINYMQHLRWVPLSNVPNYNTSDYFNIAGRVAVGPPYSDVAETRTYVPNQVSLRTFMSAVRNKRSLLYTEDLSNNTSKYGRTYQSGNRGPYFGAVCSSFTAWVMGLEALYLSKEYGDNAVPGLSSVEYNSVDDLRPLDLIWNSGHISIISDIYKDEFGAVKCIVWAEMSTPYPYRTFYTPEQFDARIVARSADVHRWDGWASIQEPEASEYSQYLLGDTLKEPKWNEDIMTYAGDYAAFAEGDVIHLNARRNSVYTGVELYKNDVLLQTIDITGLSADTIVTPNTEDWVDVNLTTLNLAYGKYKARLTDGTNYTDFTYFEIIGISMSATRSSNQITVTFGANGGTPVSIEQVKQNGFADSDGNGKYHTITAEEITAGTMTLPWTFNSTYKYLLMLVRGDYGAVPKKILFPTN